MMPVGLSLFVDRAWCQFLSWYGSIDVATESAHVVESALPETSPRLSTGAGPDGASLIPFTIISYSPAQVCRFAAFWLSFFGFMAEPKERPLKQESPLAM
jgi:hypothetical protein